MVEDPFLWLEGIDGEDAPSTVMMPELVIRESA